MFCSQCNCSPKPHGVGILYISLKYPSSTVIQSLNTCLQTGTFRRTFENISYLKTTWFWIRRLQLIEIEIPGWDTKPKCLLMLISPHMKSLFPFHVCFSTLVGNRYKSIPQWSVHSLSLPALYANCAPNSPAIFVLAQPRRRVITQSALGSSCSQSSQRDSWNDDRGSASRPPSLCRAISLSLCLTPRLPQQMANVADTVRRWGAVSRVIHH